jgi:hypothetical protein
VLAWVEAVLLGTALGLIVRIVLFLAATAALGPLAAVVGVALAFVPSADPVYTGAALGMLADVRVSGLAVAGAPGEILHQLAPGLLAPSAHAQGALARLVVEPGSPLLGRLVAAYMAHVGVLALGLVLARVGRRRGRLSLVLAGIAVQAQAVVSILSAPPSVVELEATGLSFGVNALAPWLGGRRLALSDAAAAVPAPVVYFALAALAILAAYLPAMLLASGRAGLHRRIRAVGVVGHQPALWWRARVAGSRPLFAWTLGALLFSAAVPAAVVPRPAPAASDPLLRPHSEGSRGNADAPATPTGAPASPAMGAASGGPPATGVGEVPPTRDDSTAAREARPPEALGPPSQVEIAGAAFQYQYLVNGQPEVIRGMGLNTQYARLSPDARRAQLEATLSDVRALGANTVLGWDPAEFDVVLLDLAAKHGLGVVLPFDLDPAADYTDPAVRSALTERVLAWVTDYRSHSALRMWGLGNEVLHKIVHPAWLGPQDPERDRQARAFADWLVETADAIHAADPAHPVTYREAEDAFMPWIRDALRRAGGGPRPWLVIGTNCYTRHLADVVRDWPTQGIDSPLWVSEFAPGGLAVPDRPDGFRRMWGIVRSHPEWVLGGAVYAWTRTGPEEIDRTFGLTDDGVPVDGRSLDAIAELFKGTERASGN